MPQVFPFFRSVGLLSKKGKKRKSREKNESTVAFFDTAEPLAPSAPGRFRAATVCHWPTIVIWVFDFFLLFNLKYLIFINILNVDFRNSLKNRPKAVLCRNKWGERHASRGAASRARKVLYSWRARSYRVTSITSCSGIVHFISDGIYVFKYFRLLITDLQGALIVPSHCQ